MKRGDPLRNRLRQVRRRLDLSQQELADAAGVSRQAISNLEAGLHAPSATVALRLAKALGCRVEDLFWLEETPATVEAVAAGKAVPKRGARLVVARVGDRWVAHSLEGARAFRTELIPSDGESLGARERGGRTAVRARLHAEPQHLRNTVVVSGCTPALSLWARAAERAHPDLRVHWIFANSMEALESLRRGEVHAAGVHLYDPDTGEDNTAFVRRALPDQEVVLINLGIWREGLLIQKGNPKRIRRAADLARSGVKVATREPGAGARQLFERFLEGDSIPHDAVDGFDRPYRDHWEVSLAVKTGKADAGVSAEAFAHTFDLDFIPLHRVRYDVAVRRAYLEDPCVQWFFNALGNRWVLSQLKTLGGYDTSLTGEAVDTA